MDQINILVVDDEKEIADLVEIYLVSDGYKVFKANNALDGLELIEKEDIHLVLLDIMMPGEDGFSLAPAFLEKGIPVLFLTARTAVSDRVYGLRLGADDYILKPFEPAELLARIDVILRRTMKNTYSDALLTVDFNARTVHLGQEPVLLTAMEFDLLAQLVQCEGAVLSREKLLAQVWGWDYTGESRTVDVHVQRLRAKLGADVIETVYKRGYRYTRRTEA